MNEPIDTTQAGQLDRMEMKLHELEGKLDATFASAEKMRKYFLWMTLITVGAIVIPLLILPFVIPAFLSSVTLPTDF